MASYTIVNTVFRGRVARRQQLTSVSLPPTAVVKYYIGRPNMMRIRLPEQEITVLVFLRGGVRLSKHGDWSVAAAEQCLTNLCLWMGWVVVKPLQLQTCVAAAAAAHGIINLPQLAAGTGWAYEPEIFPAVRVPPPPEAPSCCINVFSSGKITILGKNTQEVIERCLDYVSSKLHKGGSAFKT